jgi:hypothetical protein
MNIHESCRGSGVACRQHPRTDIGVVIEARDQHFIPGTQRPTESPAEVKRQRRHVGPKDDFISRGSVQQIGGGLMGLLQDRIGFAAGREDTALMIASDSRLVVKTPP